jgi:AraC-like DNA-binding protein/quercetin dioxygenase-like cupin family protein
MMHREIKRLLGDHAKHLQADILDYIKTAASRGDWAAASTTAPKIAAPRIGALNPDAAKAIEASKGAAFILPGSLFFKDAFQEININYPTEKYNGLRHRHDFFEILFVFDGHAVTSVDQDTITLDAGDACVMNPNAEHSITRFREEEDFAVNLLLSKSLFSQSFYAILFADENMNRFFNQYMLGSASPKSYMIFRGGEDAIRTVTSLITEFLHPRKYSPVVIESILIMLFAYFLRSYNPGEAGDKQTLHEILDYLGDHFAKASLKQTARRFHYHPKYLSALIKKETGRTFSDILLDLRLRRAVVYLTTTRLAVERIVEMVGYYDRSFFYRAFKKRYGLSPAQYRREWPGPS